MYSTVHEIVRPRDSQDNTTRDNTMQLTQDIQFFQKNTHVTSLHMYAFVSFSELCMIQWAGSLRITHSFRLRRAHTTSSENTPFTNTVL